MPTLQEVASAAFPVLVETATNQYTITYRALAAEIETHAYYVLPRALGHIWSWCDNQRYPHINALVISQVTGIPGRGYRPNGHPLTREIWVELRDEVHRFNQWRDLVPPEHWPPTRCGKSRF